MSSNAKPHRSVLALIRRLTMIREHSTSYLRHLHLVVHSAQQRLRLPIYVIQPPTDEETRKSPPVRSINRSSYFVLLALALCLSTAIGLLASLLAKDAICPVYDCSSMGFSSSTSRFPSTTNGNASLTSTTSPSRRDLLYGETCREHQECYASKQLFCQFEYAANEKHCFCETTHFWNRVNQQCERKKELNEECEYDHECRVDLGLTCDPKSDTTTRQCRCEGEYYWSKLSNCGELQLQDYLHCLDQQYISSCLIREIKTGIYHNVNIRQILNAEIQFDYFLVDSPEIEDMNRLECSWSTNKRYCFGIHSETNQLWIFTLDRQGIESFRQLNQSVVGLVNVLTLSDQRIICYAESLNSDLLSIIIDPKMNNSMTIAVRGKTYGERSCFLALNQTIFCFYRDSDHRLALIAMASGNTSAVVPSIIHSETNLKTSPSCGWIGSTSSLKVFCFVVFNDEQIYRLEQIDRRWGNWSRMPSEKIFIQRPLFLTSKPPDDVTSTQSCHVLAIDTSNEVYVSSNRNCVQENIFTPWTLLQTEVGILSFNSSFRLRDGRVGVFGIGIDDLPYYTTMDPNTHAFEPIQLAVSNRLND